MFKTWYCPACGEENLLPLEEYVFSPGQLDLEFACSACDTVFVVRLEFYEREPQDQSNEKP